jgi:hypothetical protein
MLVRTALPVPWQVCARNDGLVGLEAAGGEEDGVGILLLEDVVDLNEERRAAAADFDVRGFEEGLAAIVGGGDAGGDS